jgi:hypothetical protein
MLTHNEIVKSIQYIRPNAAFVVNGLDIQWLDTEQSQPTELEIQQGWIDYQAKIEIDKAEESAKRQALLNKLGITEEEAKLLLS